MTEGGVAPGHDGRIGDRRMGKQDVLHLGGRDVLAATNDPVGPAVEHGQVAVGVEAADVAGPEPAVLGEGGGGRGRVAEVAREPRRRARPRSRRRRHAPGSRSEAPPRGVGGLPSLDAPRPLRSGGPSRRSLPRTGRRSARPASPPGALGRQARVDRPAAKRDGSEGRSAVDHPRRDPGSAPGSSARRTRGWVRAHGSARRRSPPDPGEPGRRAARRPRRLARRRQGRRRVRDRAPAASPWRGAAPRAMPRALATRAAAERTATFGRPVVPEVRTATAGAPGSTGVAATLVRVRGDEVVDGKRRAAEARRRPSRTRCRR